MFDNQAKESGQRPLKAVSIGHLSREGAWGLEAPRSYLVPVLFWFTAGQGRISIDGAIRGYNAHNAVYLPANTPHACETGNRTKGIALFFGGRTELPGPTTPLHLRFNSLQMQMEMNMLVDNFRTDCSSQLPLGDEITYHRAALILLWLTQKAIAEGRNLLPAPVADLDTPLKTASGKG